MTAGPPALTARQALWLGTLGGARCLGRADEIGSLEAGKLADIALWRLDTVAHRAIADAPGVIRWPRSSSGRPPRWNCSWSAGPPVVERGELRTADMTAAARDVRARAA